MTDLQYDIIKYGGGIIAALYGFYATFTDFHEKKHGKTVLTNAGRYGLVILAISSIVSLSSDALKDRRERREKEEQANIDKAQRLASAKYENETVNQLAKLLNEAQRNLEPLSHNLELRVLLDIPVHQVPVKSYIDRLKSYGKKAHPTENGYFIMRSNDPLFPKLRRPDWISKEDWISQQDELPLATLANLNAVWVDFTRKGDQTVGLTLHARCDPSSEQPDKAMRELYYMPTGEQGQPELLHLECNTENIEYIEPSFRSRRDFDGASFYLRVFSNTLGRGLNLDYGLENLNVRMGGREEEASGNNIKKTKCTSNSLEDCFSGEMVLHVTYPHY